MTSTVYLVRHGENPANLTKEFSHHKVNYSLNPKGVVQAQQTGAYFQTQSIDAIFSSPLKRTTETAQIIAAACGLPFTIVEEFRETNTGTMEDRPATMEDWRYHNAILNDWYDGKPERSFPGGEDYTALLRRTRRALTRVLDGADGRRIIIVGHGGMFATTLKDICDNVEVGWLRRADAGNCSITELALDLVDGEPRGRLMSWGDVGHLHGWAAELVPGIPGRAEDIANPSP